MHDLAGTGGGERVEGREEVGAREAEGVALRGADEVACRVVVSGSGGSRWRLLACVCRGR